MSKVQALVIAPQPFFTPRGTPFSVYYRTLIMSELGVNVDLVTYGEGQDVNLPNVTIHRIPRFSSLGKVKIGPSPLKLFLDIFIVIWTLKLLMKKKYDIVHCHEESVFFCIYLKYIFKFKMIYDMHSSLPQQLLNFRFTTSKAVIHLFKFLEDKALKTADAVITICPDLADYVDGVIRYKSKHVMIENSIFETVRLRHNPSPIPDALDDDYDLLVAEYSLEPKLVIYAGTLEPYQGIEILLEAFKIVNHRDQLSKLLIVGGAPSQIEKYKLQAMNLGIDHVVRFTGRVPQVIAQKLCRLAAVQVSPRSAGTNTPLKIYEQLASGIPLVATNIYSHTQAIDDSVAFLVEPLPDSMAEGILKALISKREAKRISDAAKECYTENYSRPVYVKKMKKVFRELKLCVESAE